MVHDRQISFQAINANLRNQMEQRIAQKGMLTMMKESLSEPTIHLEEGRTWGSHGSCIKPSKLFLNMKHVRRFFETCGTGLWMRGLRTLQWMFRIERMEWSGAFEWSLQICEGPKTCYKGF